MLSHPIHLPLRLPLHFVVESAKRKLARRDDFRTLKIFLPVVNWVKRGSARPLDYEQDVLFRLDWARLNLAPLVERLSAAPTAEARHVVRVGLGTGKEWLQESVSRGCY
jgi:hypothetical protein